MALRHHWSPCPELLLLLAVAAGILLADYHVAGNFEPYAPVVAAIMVPLLQGLRGELGGADDAARGERE